MSARRSGRGYRAAVLGRLLLAVLGGYGIAALSAALLGRILPMARAEAVATGTLLSFAIMVAVVVAVFALRTLGRAAALVIAIALPLAAGLWLSGALAGAA